MSKKVFINAGHGGSDPGAVKHVKEKDCNLIMAKACRDYLVARGVDAHMSEFDLNDETNSSNDVLNAIKKFNPDLAIDCHNNAGGGDGFEVFHSIVGGVGKELAKNIEAEVKKIGQNSRGVKTKKNSRGGDYFYFIRETACPAVICEGAFVDNKADAAQIDTEAECKAFGEAYARGILKTLGIADKVENKSGATQNKADKSVSDNKSGAGYLVKVTAKNGLRIRNGAGLNHTIVGCITDNGVYTILEEKKADGYTWGRLKSGAGWIALEYTEKVKK